MTIYELKTHETLHEDNGNIEITRVDAGWLYHYIFRKETIFVPDNSSLDNLGYSITNIITALDRVTMAIDGLPTNLRAE